ncbi:MAG: tyrosine-type recombinase/integrase [Saprospiraceae bacterium]|nr:tyrosine-type recombinase/integrase [Candidatus Vicinibacter affinis]
MIIHRTANERIKNKTISIHNLRHSIASHLLEGGMPLQQVRQFLGHDQMELQKYIRISNKGKSKNDRRYMIKILEYLNEHYSASSTKGYENMINKYRAYMQSKAQRANYHDIIGYVSYLRKSNLHPKSLRNHLFAIKYTIGT